MYVASGQQRRRVQTGNKMSSSMKMSVLPKHYPVVVSMVFCVC